ncbi:MAG: FAD-binding oxidoreductase [Candidatus Nezhaarchaeota archaeon]|nr:FAD-binding oxidoreductase [Candidatus Nezhaarchaeota archaeon]
MPIPKRIINLLEDLVGSENVYTDEAALYAYSWDSGSLPLFSLLNNKLRFMPDVVVKARSDEDVINVLKLADKEKIPVTPRGAGTSLSGNCIPVKGGIVLDLTSMNNVKEVNPDDRVVIVEPGTVHRNLEEELREQGVFFPPEPGSANMCTIGGMLANNASGVRACKYGTTRDWVLGLRVVLPGGRIIKTGARALKDASGYNLTQIFVGSEGTLGVIVEAMLKVIPLPEHRALIIAGYPSLEGAIKASQLILRKITPSSLELVTEKYVETMNKVLKRLKYPECKAVIMIEVDGLKREVEEQVDVVIQECKSASSEALETYWDERDREELWYARNYAGFSILRMFDETDLKLKAVHIHDVCLPLSRILEYLRFAEEESSKLDISIMPFGHLGDGNLHINWYINPQRKVDIKAAISLTKRLAQKVVELGGTISAEHGVGALRAPYMKLQHGPLIEYMREIKRVFDPNDIMNPGKLWPEDEKDFLEKLLESQQS